MSAWANLQRDWTQNTDDKKVTGILLWDLSAAFDTLDVELLCKKRKQNLLDVRRKPSRLIVNQSQFEYEI